MSATAIEFNNVKLAYGSKTVLENLNFTIGGNDFVGIIGSNGSGKTTILNFLEKRLLKEEIYNICWINSCIA